jgi:hypothetical protein
MLGQAAALGYRQHTYCYREAQVQKRMQQLVVSQAGKEA